MHGRRQWGITENPGYHRAPCVRENVGTSSTRTWQASSHGAAAGPAGTRPAGARGACLALGPRIESLALRFMPSPS